MPAPNADPAKRLQAQPGPEAEPEAERDAAEVATEESAEVLAAASRLQGGSHVVQELYEYMNLLGIQGIGLVEATQRCPLIGELIGGPAQRTCCTLSALRVAHVRGGLPQGAPWQRLLSP